MLMTFERECYTLHVKKKFSSKGEQNVPSLFHGLLLKVYYITEMLTTHLWKILVLQGS